MSSLYSDAAQMKRLLCELIRNEIDNHPSVKAAIKAKKAIITTTANTTQPNKVGVKLMGDETEIFLPYSSKFTASQLTVGTVVSVWYNYTIKNGIVYENGSWSQ
mgnify:CR=1 FL=1